MKVRSHKNFRNCSTRAGGSQPSLSGRDGTPFEGIEQRDTRSSPRESLGASPSVLIDPDGEPLVSIEQVYANNLPKYVSLSLAKLHHIFCCSLFVGGDRGAYFSCVLHLFTRFPLVTSRFTRISICAHMSDLRAQYRLQT